MCTPHLVLLAGFFEVWAWDAAHTAQEHCKQAWIQQPFSFKKEKKETS